MRQSVQIKSDSLDIRTSVSPAPSLTHTSHADWCIDMPPSEKHRCWCSSFLIHIRTVEDGERDITRLQQVGLNDRSLNEPVKHTFSLCSSDLSWQRNRQWCYHILYCPTLPGLIWGPSRTRVCISLCESYEVSLKASTPRHAYLAWWLWSVRALWE